MIVFSIVLLVLLGSYIVVWCVDRFIVTPKREYKSLPELTRRLDELEKRLGKNDKPKM